MNLPGFFTCESRSPFYPFRHALNFRDELNKLFNGEGITFADEAKYPAVNIFERGDALVVTAELPGIQLADIDVTVSGRSLTLKGERKLEPLGTDERYLRRERENGEFIRKIELPFEVQNAKVDATYRHGILTITLPRAEQEKAKKIVVK